MLAIWIIPLVAVYAISAWMEGVLEWRVRYLMDSLIEYAQKEGLCSIT